MDNENNAVVTLKVRVTPEFREKITRNAKTNNRSMNQEIINRLEKSFIFDDIDRITSDQNTNRGVAGLNTRSKPVAFDPRERRRLAILAADAALKALDEDKGE